MVSPCEFHTAADCIRKLQPGKQGGILFGDCGGMIRSEILNRVLVAGLARPHLGDKIPRVGGRAITMSDDPSAHLLGQCFKIHHMCQTKESLREDMVSPCEFHAAVGYIRKLQRAQQARIFFDDCRGMIAIRDSDPCFSHFLSQI